jgi:hypothetical protein
VAILLRRNRLLVFIAPSARPRITKRTLSSATRAQGRAPPPQGGESRQKPRFLFGSTTLVTTTLVTGSPMGRFILVCHGFLPDELLSGTHPEERAGLHRYRELLTANTCCAHVQLQAQQDP